jgi:hypothetical protein
VRTGQEVDVLKNGLRGWVVVLCAVALMGAGAVLVGPATAVTGISWQHVWRHQIEPRADHRYYTKAKADHRYAFKPRVLRGDFELQGAADVGDELYAEGISWGWNFHHAPRVHVIAPFAKKLPRGCFGNVNHPNARRGNLCVFERFTSTNADRLEVCDSFNECPSADPWGATLGAFVTGAGLFGIDGTWAVRRL